MRQRIALVKIRRPFRRRHFRHAAEEPLRRPGAHQQISVGAAHDKSRAAAQDAFPFRHAARKAFGVAARIGRTAFVPWTQRAGRFLRRAERGAEIHHRLREIAGAMLWRNLTRKPAQFRLRPGQRRLNCKQPRHHPLDIAVHRARRCIEGNRGNRGRRVVADARQRTQLGLARRKYAAMALDDGTGAGMQIARARIVAEPGPGLEHLIERCRCERMHVAPAREEAVVIRRHGPHRGLLQHDFGEPDPIRIGALAFARTPRQRPAMAVVPGKQRCGGWQCPLSLC